MGSGGMTFMQPERRFQRRGWIGMKPATQYREFAEECDRLAKEAKIERHRQVLQEMAETWRRLAQEADADR